mmetsp:Transcript_13508/g.24458  ORF Transcript_13508/g.24458 Transcript_13508/m.24458 type:complete len:95 (-) Transcript_13508:319-603(-)
MRSSSLPHNQAQSWSNFHKRHHSNIIDHEEGLQNSGQSTRLSSIFNARSRSERSASSSGQTSPSSVIRKLWQRPLSRSPKSSRGNIKIDEIYLR